jgi:hypothetical protein
MGGIGVTSARDSHILRHAGQGSMPERREKGASGFAWVRSYGEG